MKIMTDPTTDWFRSPSTSWGAFIMVMVAK